MAGRRTPRVVWLGLAALVVVSTLAGAQTEVEVGESEARAAILYNLSRFVEWPEGEGDSDKPLIIAAVGNRELFAAMSMLERKRVNGRPIETRFFANLAAITECHVLHFDRSLLPAGERAPTCGDSTLTVSTDDDALGSGVVAAVWIQQGRLAFSVNLDAAREQRLRFSSNVLMLAERVVQSQSQ